MQPTEQQLAQLAVEFLKRSDLKGGEAKTLTVVMDWLEAKAKQQPRAEPHEVMFNEAAE